jgi:hypothetical protein
VTLGQVDTDVALAVTFFEGNVRVNGRVGDVHLSVDVEMVDTLARARGKQLCDRVALDRIAETSETRCEDVVVELDPPTWPNFSEATLRENPRRRSIIISTCASLAV